MSLPPDRLPYWDYQPRGQVQPRPRRRRVLLIAIGVFALTGGGVAIAGACLHDEKLTDIPPARTVASAYWVAVQHKNLTAMRRLLCDDDRVLLSAMDDQTLTRMLFPAARTMLGYTITGQRDQPGVTVVFVEVERSDSGRVSTATRPTPVVEQSGMFTVCFHSVGLYPGT
ncbi:MAG: hypothetical protein V7637_5954 [Mycobacteriales bacterium]